MSTLSSRANHFDNAGWWPEPSSSGRLEKHIILKVAGEPAAAINLATLLAWATEYGKSVQALKLVRDDPEKAREMAREALAQIGGSEIDVDNLAFMVSPTGEVVDLT
jgi:hypothetical protein